jgi:SPX domain protein involved in polyphosphate accumulation
MLSQLGTLERDAKQLGQDFLALEKFVNLNYQAFEKLLKNHDRCSLGLLALLALLAQKYKY